jgi:hypothetical protein
MEKEIISIEVAEKEWKNYLESNDASHLIPDEELKNSSDEAERKQFKENKNGFDRIVRAISKGIIVIEDNVITQKLQYPIMGQDKSTIVLEKLVYNQRVTARDREDSFKGLSETITTEAMIAQRRFCARLTGAEMILLGKLDMVDLKITDQIVSVFFM